MTAVRHLGFSKVGNFNFRSGLEAHCASYAKFREATLNRSVDMADFRFSRWRPPPWCSRGSNCVCMPNFGEMAQNAAEILRFFHFSRWRSSAILDFHKLEISTSGLIWRPNMRHRTKFREDRSDCSGDMADLRFFKMAAAAILDFGNFKFLTVWTLKRVELRLHAKCWRNRSKRGWDIAIFPFFKMAAVRHLGFSKVGNFNFRSRSEAQYASSCQISLRSVEPFQRYCLQYYY